MKHALVALGATLMALNATAQSATDEIAKYREMIADGKLYSTTKETKVTLGGCGG